MFPTSGFFRSHNCPYYLSGLCERPYCHFRHVKQEDRLPASHSAHLASKNSRHGSESRPLPAAASTGANAAAGPAKRSLSESSDVATAGGGCAPRDYTPTPLSVLRRHTSKESAAVAVAAAVSTQQQTAPPPAEPSYEPTPLAPDPAAPLSSASSATTAPTVATSTRRRPLQLPAPKSGIVATAETAPAAAGPGDAYDPTMEVDAAGSPESSTTGRSKRSRRHSPSPPPPPQNKVVAAIDEYEPTPIGDGGGSGGGGYGDSDGGVGDDNDDDEDEYCPTAVTAPKPTPQAADNSVNSSSGSNSAGGSGIQRVFLDLFGEEPTAKATAKATAAATTTASSMPTLAPKVVSNRVCRPSPAEQVARRAQLAAADPSALSSQGKVRAPTAAAASSAPAPALAVSLVPPPPPATPLAGSVANKIPAAVRQRYLDRLVEECRLSAGASLVAAAPEASAAIAKRAQQLELECYERSANRTVYLNAVILAIKRVRSAAPAAEATSASAAPAAAAAAANASQLSDKRLHKHLMRYVLTAAQLADNHYPPHLPELPYAAPANPLERLCVRCGAAFVLVRPELSVPPGQCCYHYGRAYSRRVPGAGIQQIYGCCGGDTQAKGCSLGDRHVHEYNVYCDNAAGYRRTAEPDKATVRKKQRLAVYALDCEMVYTDAGKELARVTMVDRSLAVVYDRLVRPSAPIVDCNTRFSGLKEDQLTAAEHSLPDVQQELLQRLHSTCVLIGHSLESDLQVLKLRHDTVVDTSIVFPHRMGLPKKRALKTLANEILNKIIQAGGDAGHDSSEDARTCMELMLHKVTEDLRKARVSGQ